MQSIPSKLTIVMACVVCLLGWSTAATENSDTGNFTNRVEVSGGVMVELAGVCRFPINDKQWWHPNGSLLAKPPIETVNDFVSDDALAYVFAINVSEDVFFRHEFSDGRVSTSCKQLKPLKDHNLKYPYTIVALMPASVMKELTQIDLSVGVSTAQPRILATYKQKRLMPVTYEDGGAVFHPPCEESSSVVIPVSHTDHQPYRETWVVAYDKDNRLHRSRSSEARTNGFVSGRYEFKNLSLTNLDRVELRGRSFEWVDFTNISFSPGRATKLETWARLNPEDDTGRMVPGGDSAEHLIGRRIKPFELPDASGTRHRLIDLKGKVTLINLFATWCGPCRAEMPHLARLRSKYEPESLGIVVIADSDKPDDIDKFSRQNRLPFSILIDRKSEITKRFANERGKVTHPTNVLLNTENKIIYADYGFTKDDWENLERTLHKALAPQGD